MKYMLEFELVGLPKMPNRMSKRSQWGSYNESKKWHRLVHLVTAGKRPKAPLERAEVEFTRSAHGVEPDSDGLAHSFKYVRDGLKKSGIIVDDSPAHLRALYAWEKGKMRAGFIRVKVTEVTEEPEDDERAGRNADVENGTE